MPADEVRTRGWSVRGPIRSPWFSKAVATAAVATLTSLVLPGLLRRAGRVVQDRQKERELKVTVSEGIVEPLTTAVTRAQLFASGLLSAAGSNSAGTPRYGDVLEEWLTASSKAGAQLDTYLERRDATNERIRQNWLPLFSSVTDYVRLSTDLESFDRPAAVDRIRESLDGYYPGETLGIDWNALQDQRRADAYYRSFRQLGDRLLAARDSLLSDLRSARLAGFTRHLFEFW